MVVERVALLCYTQVPAGGHGWRWDPGWALGHPSAKPANQGAGVPFAGRGQSWGKHGLWREDSTHHSLVHLRAALPLQAGLEPLGHTVSCSLGRLDPLLDLGVERWDWGSPFAKHGSPEAISLPPTWVSPPSIPLQPRASPVRGKGSTAPGQDSSLFSKPFPLVGACHSLNAVVLDLPSGTRADPSTVTWMCWQGKSQAGTGQVPTPRHKQAHACRPSPRLTCSKSSGRSSVASWALWRKEKEQSADGSDLHPASSGRQVLMHLTHLSLGSWEQETLAMAWTIIYKAMGRMSPGG